MGFTQYPPENHSRTVTDADATAAIGDNGGIIYMSSASAHSVTFPTACKVPNFNCIVMQIGAGTVSLVGTSNLSSLSDLGGQRAAAGIIYSANLDEFVASGQLA